MSQSAARAGEEHPETTEERRLRAIESLQAGSSQDLAASSRAVPGPGRSEDRVAAEPAEEMVSPEDGGAALNPSPDELMTLTLEVADPQMDGNGGGDVPKTMRIQVPRRGVDAGDVGAAVAQSLQQLNRGVAGESTTLPAVRQAPQNGGRSPSRSFAEEGEFVAEEASSLGRELSLRDVLYMVRERWVLGLSVGLLFAFAWGYWMMSKQPVYEAQAQLRVERKEEKVLPGETSAREIYRTLKDVTEDHVMRLQTSEYRRFVLNKLEREVLPGKGGDGEDERRILREFSTFAAFKKAYLEKLGQRRRDEKSGPTLADADRLFEEHFNGPALEVSSEEGTGFLVVSFRHPDSLVAKQVAQAYAECYSPFLAGKEKGGHDDVLGHLMGEQKKLEDEIRGKEGKLQVYREEHGIVETEEDEETTSSRRINELQGNVTAVRLAMRNIEVQLERIKEEVQLEGAEAEVEGQKEVPESTELRIEEDVELERIETISVEDALRLSKSPGVADFGSVKEVQAKLDANREEKAHLEEKLLPKHHKIIGNEIQRNELLLTLSSNVVLAVEDLKSRVIQKREEEKKLRDYLKEAEDDALGDKEKIFEYHEMKGQLDILKSRQDSLFAEVTRRKILAIYEGTPVDITMGAVLPKKPVEPVPWKVLALASLIFLGGLFGLPIGLGLMDTRLKSFSEAAAFLGVECLGCVPERTKLGPAELGRCVLAEGDGQIVESFQVIYGAADLHSRVAFPKVIVTTSTGPGEGKSFVTANLGAMFARHGKRVLIIDSDLRKPTQHKMIELRNQAGLLKWFNENGAVPATARELLEDASLGLVPMSDEHDLFLLRSGGSSRNPCEIITSERFEALLHNLRFWFDVILLDSPPVGLFPDALFMANFAEEALFVCKHNGLNRHKIKFALTKMQGGHAEVLGTIMNQLSTSRRHQYGYGYKDYGYGSYSYREYGNYYHAEDDD